MPHCTCFTEVTAICITVIVGPILDRSIMRKKTQISRSALLFSKADEFRPQILHMLPVCRRLGSPDLVSIHAQDPHHRFQSALCTESIQLVGIRSPSMIMEQFGILPMAAMRVGEISIVWHRSSCFSSSVSIFSESALRSGASVRT